MPLSFGYSIFLISHSAVLNCDRMTDTQLQVLFREAEVWSMTLI